MDKNSKNSLQEYFANLFNQLFLNKDKVVIYNYDRKVNSIVQIEDVELLEELEDDYYCSLADQELQKDESFSWDSVKSELGL